MTTIFFEVPATLRIAIDVEPPLRELAEEPHAFVTYHARLDDLRQEAVAAASAAGVMPMPAGGVFAEINWAEATLLDSQLTTPSVPFDPAEAGTDPVLERLAAEAWVSANSPGHEA